MGRLSGRLYGNLYRDDIISTSDGGAGTFTVPTSAERNRGRRVLYLRGVERPQLPAPNKNQWSSDNEWIYAAFAREFFIAKMGGEFMANMLSNGARFSSTKPK